MADKQFTKDNAFSNEAHLEFSAIPEVATDATEDMSAEEVVMAVAFSGLLWEVLTDDQKASLTNWERAALERLAEMSDDMAMEYVGTKLRN